MKFFNLFQSSNKPVVFSEDAVPNMSISITVNPSQQDWQERITSILAKLEGVRGFELDSEKATVKILGNIQPDYLMGVLNKSSDKAMITKARMIKDGVVDICAEPAEPNCICPRCCAKRSGCPYYKEAQNYDHYQQPYYQHQPYYQYQKKTGLLPPPQAPIPQVPPPPYYNGGGYGIENNYPSGYYNNPPVNAVTSQNYDSAYPGWSQYNQGWSQPSYMEPYYEEDESVGCTIM